MIIYKITNKINDKVYIGITTRSIKLRWKEHCSIHSKCYMIKKAINKYGKENFIIEQIDNASNKNELKLKEVSWIIALNSLSPNGYNISLGNQNLSITEETRRKQSQSKKGILNPNFGTNTTAKSIRCLNNGKTYLSASDASKELNITRSNIVRVCKKERKHVNGYVFEYIESHE